MALHLFQPIDIPIIASIVFINIFIEINTFQMMNNPHFISLCTTKNFVYLDEKKRNKLIKQIICIKKKLECKDEFTKQLNKAYYQCKTVTNTTTNHFSFPVENELQFTDTGRDKEKCSKILIETYYVYHTFPCVSILE